MDEIPNIVVTALNSLADDIRQNMANANENATGRTKASFEVKIDKDSISLVAKAGDRAPISTLEIGRGAGKQPPIEAIEEWVTAKFGFVGKEATAFAWAVAKKIAKIGTDRHYNNEDIYTTATKETAKILTEDLQKKITEKIKENIIKSYLNG
ncbi:MAG: hypothetical protein U0O22_04520 [Acutalibacteraceae bacterium]